MSDLSASVFQLNEQDSDTARMVLLTRSASLAEHLLKLLSGLPVQLVTFNQRLPARDYIIRHPPELVIVDYRFQSALSSNFIKQIRNNPESLYLPIIAITPTISGFEKADSDFVNDVLYLKDPLLVTRIRYHLFRYRNHRQILGLPCHVLVVGARAVVESRIRHLFIAEPQDTITFCPEVRYALARLETTHPDVILVALSEQIDDSLQFIDMIKLSRDYHAIPVLVLLLRQQIELRVRVLNYGVNDILLPRDLTVTLPARIQNISRQYSARSLPELLAHPESLLEDMTYRMFMIHTSYDMCEKMRQRFAGRFNTVYAYSTQPRRSLVLARQFRPSLIILEHPMPKLDNRTLIQIIRQDPVLKNVPVILMTQQLGMQDLKSVHTSGAQDIIDATIPGYELRHRVRYHANAFLRDIQMNAFMGSLERMTQVLNQTKADKDTLRNTFNQYMSESVVSYILDSPSGSSLGGQKQTITILMMDLRGFTHIASQVSTDDLVAILNIYFDVMTQIIHQYEGTIDEIIGDAILALFGTPVRNRLHAHNAVRCACAMQNAMPEVNQTLRDAGFPELQMGIGINTGEVMVGNLGSRHRTKFGVVGHEVNLTARIESNTAGGQILISEATYNVLGDQVEVAGSRFITVKGMHQPITLYDVIGINTSPPIRLSQHSTPLQPLSEPIAVTVFRFEEKNRHPVGEPAWIAAANIFICELHTAALFEIAESIEMTISIAGSILMIQGKILSICQIETGLNALRVKTSTRLPAFLNRSIG